MDQPTIEEVHKDESAPARPEAAKLHWLLKRNDGGEIVIRWGPALGRLVLMLASFVFFSWLVNLVLGQPFRPTRNAVLYGLMVVCFIWYLGSIQRKAQGKPKWQFNLRDVLVLITVVALMFAVNHWERNVRLKLDAARQQLTADLEQVVGTGKVTIAGHPGRADIFVTRTSFDDHDLEEIIALTERSSTLNCSITGMSLMNTQVTDRGAAALAGLTNLEYCLLDGTQLTDKAVDSLQTLVNLKLISVSNTSVTEPRLRQLSLDRPDMKILSMPVQKP